MAWQNCEVWADKNEILRKILTKQIAESVMLLCIEFSNISVRDEA